MTLGLMALASLSLAGPAAAAPPQAHGQLLHLVHRSPGALNAAQSNNWFGYNLGALAGGGAPYHAISATWSVPRATQHRRGQSEASSDWIGIGGGCVDAGCLLTDATLIQTGTEQDVSSAGVPSYSAWWEVIPGPSMPLHLKIRPGDRIRASITELLPASNVWRITLRDLTRGTSHTLRVPYSSTQDSAEWIEETPLILGTGGGFASLPNLTSPRFDRATVNGRGAGLRASRAIDLINSSGRVIGAPSSPDRDRDGFAACAWAPRCPAPTRT